MPGGRSASAKQISTPPRRRIDCKAEALFRRRVLRARTQSPHTAAKSRPATIHREVSSSVLLRYAPRQILSITEARFRGAKWAAQGRRRRGGFAVSLSSGTSGVDTAGGRARRCRGERVFPSSVGRTAGARIHRGPSNDPTMSHLEPYGRRRHRSFPRRPRHPQRS